MNPKAAAPDEKTRALRQRCGSALTAWAALPPTRANRRYIIWTGLTMLLIVIASRHEVSQVALVRDLTMVMMGVHGLLHVTLLGAFDWLSRKGIPEAQRAREAYLAPRRVTNLDLAAVWAAFFAIVAILRAILPFAAPE